MENISSKNTSQSNILHKNTFNNDIFNSILIPSKGILPKAYPVKTYKNVVERVFHNDGMDVLQ